MIRHHALASIGTFLSIIGISLSSAAVTIAPPPTVFVVTNTSDYGASDPPINGSLRWAMTQANTDGTPSRITFDIGTASDPGCALGGPCTIQPVRALPLLSAGNTEIDGYTQTGATEAVGGGFANLKIEVDGTNVAGANGFSITSAGNVIRGLVINRFGYWGIAIFNPAADANTIAGNYIGTDTTGLVCAGMGNGNSGVGIENGAGNNIIGGFTAADRNIISCNHLNGVDISDLSNSGSTSGNQVIGNWIGDPGLGPPDQGNTGAGVFIGHGAFDNSVGGASAGAGNAINHNGGDGVQVYGPETTGNIIAGNAIGVNPNGSTELPNNNAGVNLIGGTHGNTVGGPTEAEYNTISNNGNSGVRIAGPATRLNAVYGNYIGTNSDGTFALGNLVAGVLLEDEAWGNQIGPVNLISGNNGPGVMIREGSHDNVVQTNFIGTNGAGTSAIPNTIGVLIEGAATDNTIGGPSVANSNLISGNSSDGIRISGDGTDGNEIFSNAIGTNYGATTALANSTGVIIMNGAQFNVVGGPTSGNLISGNTASGVGISGSGSNENTVAGNVIGLNGAGTLALPNSLSGVHLNNGAQGNLIGGSEISAGNVISGNGQDGINVADASTTDNVIAGNFIGIDPSGTSAIANGVNGIILTDGTNGNIVGGGLALERNVISGNGGYGVLLDDEGTDGNQIAGNYIGTDATGASALGNAQSGVSIQGGSASNMVGGTSPGEGNVISGNSSQGVYLVNAGTSNNTVAGNIIGLNPAGSAAIPNSGSGVFVQLNANANTIGGSTEGARNVISGNLDRGIVLSTCNDTVVEGNYIGTDRTGTLPLGNGYDGIQIRSGSLNNVIGPNNRIANNGYFGVGISDLATTGNIVTASQIYDNGLAGIRLLNGANGGMMPAYIGTITLNPITISGTACAGCMVEVFANPEDVWEGRIYLASTSADGSGDWSLVVGSIPAPYLTATATDATNGSSEFAYNVVSSISSVYLPLITR